MWGGQFVVICPIILFIENEVGLVCDGIGLECEAFITLLL
jgi:hypothetical protein